MTITMEASRWLRRFHQDPSARARAVCLPHAGGSASFWFPFSQAMPPGLEAVAVQYPGRQERFLEEPLRRIGELADSVARLLAGQPAVPLVLVGHSMGATIAFETAHRLRERGVALEALYVSAQRGPSLPREPRGVYLRDDAGVADELRRLGGTDPDLLADPAVLELLLPAVRADYEAVETYAFTAREPLECPVVALVGDADPNVTVEQAAAWREQTTGAFDLRVLPGGHFALADRQEAVAALVAARLAQVRG